MGADGPAWNVSDVATALGVTSRAIEHLKKRFVGDGLGAVLDRKPRGKPPREVTFDGAFEVALPGNWTANGENKSQPTASGETRLLDSTIKHIPKIKSS
jgi:hypothetical protein